MVMKDKKLVCFIGLLFKESLMYFKNFLIYYGYVYTQFIIMQIHFNW